MNQAELTVNDMLQELGFIVKAFQDISNIDLPGTFYSQAQYLNWILDFADFTNKIAIEVDGIYWHGNNKPTLNIIQVNNKVRDKIKNSKLQNDGWKIIRVWSEHVILHTQTNKQYLFNKIFCSLPY